MICLLMLDIRPVSFRVTEKTALACAFTQTYCHRGRGPYNPSLRHASIFTGRMGHLLSILKLFLSEIANPYDLRQEYVLVWRLKGLYLGDKRPAACHSSEMNETIKS